MREIKFRVWDKERNVMKQVTQLDFSYYRTLPHAPQGQINGIWAENEDVDIIPSLAVLMQYTGVKDMNGREVYEGDILKHSNIHVNNACYGVVEKEKDTNNLVITIYYTGLHGDKRLRIPLNCASDYVVVGNIYENPELLEGGNEND